MVQDTEAEQQKVRKTAKQRKLKRKKRIEKYDG